ncbi:hypothetical protein PG984_006921 [Apiospora sp. TS-2023a]
MVMEAALCQPRLVHPVEYRNPWCYPTPPPPDHETIKYRYKIVASPDKAAMTYGTTPAVLVAVSQYLRSLTRQLWRMFIGAQTFLFGNVTNNYGIRYGAANPILKFFASQPRWVLPYYRHIATNHIFECYVWYESAPMGTLRPIANLRQARTFLSLLSPDVRLTAMMFLPYLSLPPNYNNLGVTAENDPEVYLSKAVKFLGAIRGDIERHPLDDKSSVLNMPGYEVALQCGPNSEHYALGYGALPPCLSDLPSLPCVPRALEALRAFDKSLAWRRQYLAENPVEPLRCSEEEIREAYLASGLLPSDLDSGLRRPG